MKTDPHRKGIGIQEHNLASAFEVFVDGQRIFQSGRVAPFEAYTSDAKLLAPIPDTATSAGSFLIALRVHNSEIDWSSENPGLFPENLILGQEKALYNSIWMGWIGLLLVFGDVAGKGMPAAMLVAVLLGAIRTVARFTHDPAEILAELNTRLQGRTSGGFSTCLAAFIDPGGRMKLANAGQLPPYLDGEELQTPGALPLGIAPLQTYETCEFSVAPGSRIVFYSDGVIEAQNQAGNLLGFERSRTLSALPAEEIARAAADFGQNDDHHGCGHRTRGRFRAKAGIV